MNRRGLTARPLSYREFLGFDQTITVPSGQSGYAWGADEWDDLWDDLVALRKAPDEYHFLGTLVVEARSGLEFLVWDGQQRLVTLGVLALAVFCRIHRLVERGIESDHNRVWAQRVWDRFVAEKHPVTLVEMRKLSLNATDDPFFRDTLIRLREPADLPALPRSNRLLYDCLHTFDRRLGELEDLRDNGEALRNFVFDTVADRTLFVSIVVRNEDDAIAVRNSVAEGGRRLRAGSWRRARRNGSHVYLAAAAPCGARGADLEV